jgi:hypothetical protein
MSSAPGRVFTSSGQPGYSTAVTADARHVRARKLIREVQVHFTPTDCSVRTREGVVQARPGDAIVTGTQGEHWRVSRAHFAAKYQPVPPGISWQDGRYCSLPNLIVAVSMSEAFEVVLTDGVSRLRGQAGDWLVDYGDGSLGIVSKDIFASTYQIVP